MGRKPVIAAPLYMYFALRFFSVLPPRLVDWCMNRFTAEVPDRTLVELEHRNLDRHGEGWEGMRDAVGSPNGWNLEHYAEVAVQR